MTWLTANRRVKFVYAVAALVTTCGAAMAATDAEQMARFKDGNQWGAPAGNLNQTRYSTLKDINTTNVKDLSMIWAQSSGTLRGHEGQPLVIENVGGKPMMDSPVIILLEGSTTKWSAPGGCTYELQLVNSNPPVINMTKRQICMLDSGGKVVFRILAAP